MPSISGELRVPADKSIGHRALLLAGMTSGSSSLSGEFRGEDLESTARCLRALGVEVSQLGETEVTVTGRGWKVPDQMNMYAGNSGTSMRLLAGALAGRRGRFTLTGDASLNRRPMGRVAEPLRLMGAQVELAEDAHAPVTVSGGSLEGIEYLLPVPSAQIKSAILLAGLQAGGATTVIERLPSRDHTERILEWLGARIRRRPGSVSIEAGNEVFESDGFRFEVPGDLSSAAYFLAAAVLSPKGRVEVLDVGLNPGRGGFLDVLASMGARIDVELMQADPEPKGTVRARSSSLRALRVDGELVPRSVDELPLVALLATQAEGTTVIADAAELRVKESDRISVLARGLDILGARITEQPDGLVIEGPTPLRGGVVDAAGDHRMALTFAVAGTIARDPVVVRGWEAAAVSFPHFEQFLAGLAG
jgi:3-phosphoshikimate 1-carboxyvinyltransferase